MFKKMFGGKTDSHPLPSRAVLERQLADIAIGAVPLEFACLLYSKGEWIASYPPAPAPGSDVITAMSTAMFALGERIAKELKNGDFDYTLIAGQDKITIVIRLNPVYLLVIGGLRSVAVERYLQQVQQQSAGLLAALHLD